jgi:hypothetical protein
MSNAFSRQATITKKIFWLAGAAVLLYTSAAAVAQEEVAVIASQEGASEIERGGERIPAKLGGSVYLGDTVHTGPASQLRLVFRDESVLNVGTDSTIVIDENVFDPAAGAFDSVMRLLSGKVRAVVSDYYGQRNARYEIQTRTSVAGVRGTEFIISHDPASDVTEVIGISGEVEVRSLLARRAQSVFIHSGEASRVVGSQPPTAPSILDDNTYRQRIEELAFIGTGRAESFTSQHGVVAGVTVPEPDRADANPDTGKGALSVESRTKPDRNAGNLIDEPGLLDVPAGLRVRF